MFEITLGNNKKFSATSVDERYNPANTFSLSKYTLSIDINPTTQTIEEYVELFDSVALSSPIKVTLDGEDCATYTDYHTLSTLNIRLNDDGIKVASITLEKAG